MLKNSYGKQVVFEEKIVGVGGVLWGCCVGVGKVSLQICVDWVVV